MAPVGENANHPMNGPVMKRLLQITLALMAFGVAGCDEGKYPITGKTCTESDPVQKLDASDCTVPPTS